MDIPVNNENGGYNYRRLPSSFPSHSSSSPPPSVNLVDELLSSWYRGSVVTESTGNNGYRPSRASPYNPVTLYPSLAYLPQSYRTYIESLNYSYKYPNNEVLIEYSKVQEYRLVQLLQYMVSYPIDIGYHTIDRIVTVLNGYRLYSSSFEKSVSGGKNKNIKAKNTKQQPNPSSVYDTSSSLSSSSPLISNLPNMNLTNLQGHWLERIRLLHLLGLLYHLQHPLLCTRIITSLNSIVYSTIEEPYTVLQNTVSYQEYLSMYNNDNIYTTNNAHKWKEHEQQRKLITNVYTLGLNILMTWNTITTTTVGTTPPTNNKNTSFITSSLSLSLSDRTELSTKLSSVLIYLTNKRNITLTTSPLPVANLLPFHDTVLSRLVNHETIYSNYGIPEIVYRLWCILQSKHSKTKGSTGKPQTNKKLSSSSSTTTTNTSTVNTTLANENNQNSSTDEWNNRSFTEIIDRLTFYEQYEILRIFLLHDKNDVSLSSSSASISTNKTALLLSSSALSTDQNDWMADCTLGLNQIEMGLEIFGYTKDTTTVLMETVHDTNIDDIDSESETVQENVSVGGTESESSNDDDNENNENDDEDWEDITENRNTIISTANVLSIEGTTDNNASFDYSAKEGEAEEEEEDYNDLLNQPLPRTEDTEITIALPSTTDEGNGTSLLKHIPKIDTDTCDPDVLRSIHESTNQLLRRTMPYIDIIMYLVRKLVTRTKLSVRKVQSSSSFSSSNASLMASSSSSSFSSNTSDIPSFAEHFSVDMQSILHKIYHLRDKLVSLFLVMDEMGIMINSKPNRKEDNNNNFTNTGTMSNDTENSLLSMLKIIRNKMQRKERQKQRHPRQRTKTSGGRTVKGTFSSSRKRVRSTSSTKSSSENTIANYYSTKTATAIPTSITSVATKIQSKPAKFNTSSATKHVNRPSAPPKTKLSPPPQSAAQRLKHAMKKQKFSH